MLDNDLLMAFGAKAESEGTGYQTLINQALRQAAGSAPIDEAALRRMERPTHHLLLAPRDSEIVGLTPPSRNGLANLVKHLGSARALEAIQRSGRSRDIEVE
jgi:hypothetical protein